MMKQQYLSLVLCGALFLLVFCGSEDPENKKLVRIGMTVLRQYDVNAFSRITQNYPTTPPEFALPTRPPVSAFIECEAIYKKERYNPANWTYRRSPDWQWKKRYYMAVNYMTEVLQRHLGYSDKELRKYYDEHKSEFVSTVLSDSAGKPCTTAVTASFDTDVKRQIAEKLFLQDYEPDSAFLATMPINDENAVRGRWIKYMRYEGYRDVFLKKFYKEKYGSPYPDSLDDLVGDGKILSQKDLDVILSWVPEERREMLRGNKQSLADFSKWLMRWLLFSERAEKTGYASKPEIQAALKWAWRFELAQRHMTNKLGPKAKKMASIDSSMALYSYWDEYGNPGRAIDTSTKNSHFKHLLDQQTNDHFHGLLYDIRRRAGVKFLTQDWRDEKNKNPKQLLHQADSLRDTGSTTEAETIYRTLATDYVFTPQGKKALVELAKLQTEQQIYTEAIRNYRRVLITDADAGKRCNFMFMIGFIYDEYLDRPEMAEVNYKWVMKNTPDCELADDAEFMMLHLDEQMTSVEELQAEVRRQGKKVESSDADTAGLTVESEPINEKK